MIAFQGCYYALVDMWKEFGPVENKVSRDFSAGVIAEGFAAPVYSPFAVISQRQMVAGCGIAQHEAYSGVVQSMRHMLSTVGPRAFFRGMGITIAMLPVAGCWWALYEYLKHVTYATLNAPGPASLQLTSWAGTLPRWATSTTDNLVVNFALGSTASCVVAVVANPFYVLRSRVQVMQVPAGTKLPTMWVARDLLEKEGMRGLLRGLRTNIVACTLEGAVFATMYEGVRYLADPNA
jgi:hypothetical protein